MLTIEKNHTKEKNYTKRYIIYTYALFWTMVAIVGVIYVQTGLNQWFFQWGSSVCSWTPTIILLVLFEKIFPDITIKDFYKKAFSQKVNISLILIVSVILAFIVTGSVFMMSVYNNVPFLSLWNLSGSTLLSVFFFTMIQGATGEESGWRGYLQPVMEKKSGVIKGSLMVGVVWSFWHTPILISTGLGLGWINLLLNFAAFIINNISLALIIGICYDYNKNLFVPIWIHFLTNFLANLYIGDLIQGRCWVAAFCVITAAGFVLWYKIRISRNSSIIQES